MLDFASLYSFCQKLLTYLTTFIQQLYFWLEEEITIVGFEVGLTPLDLMFVSFPIILTAFLVARIVL